MARERHVRRRTADAVSGVAVLGVSWLIYWLIDERHLDGGAIGVVAGVVAAVATAVAAIAAMQAARSSNDISRRAAEALGRTIAPHVQAGVKNGWHPLEPVEQPTAFLRATRYPAVDVVLRVRVSGGPWQQFSIPRLDPVDPTDGPEVGAEFPLDGPLRGRGLDEVVVTYRDEQRLLQWQTRSTRRWVDDDPETQDGLGIRDVMDETRLLGP